MFSNHLKYVAGSRGVCTNSPFNRSSDGGGWCYDPMPGRVQKLNEQPSARISKSPGEIGARRLSLLGRQV